MSSDYTIVDITPQQSTEYLDALHVVLGETQKVPPLDARFDLKRSISDWSARHGLDLAAYEVVLGTDNDENVRIVLPGLTIDHDGDIVRKTRDYIVTASFTVEVQHWVEASSEEEARDAAEDEFNGLEFDTDRNVVVFDTQYDGITDVDEQ